MTRKLDAGGSRSGLPGGWKASLAAAALDLV